MHEFVGVGDFRLGDMFVLEVHCVGKAFTLGVFDVAIVDPVMLWGCVEIPSIHTVKCPCSSLVSFFMNLDFTSHGGKWHFIVIERATEMGVGRNGGSCIGLPGEIQSDFCLRQQSIPKMLFGGCDEE